MTVAVAVAAKAATKPTEEEDNAYHGGARTAQEYDWEDEDDEENDAKDEDEDES